MPRTLGEILDDQAQILHKKDEPEFAPKWEALEREYREMHDRFFGIKPGAAIAKQMGVRHWETGDPEGDAEVA